MYAGRAHGGPYNQFGMLLHYTLELRAVTDTRWGTTLGVTGILPTKCKIIIIIIIIIILIIIIIIIIKILIIIIIIIIIIKPRSDKIIQSPI